MQLKDILQILILLLKLPTKLLSGLLVQKFLLGVELLFQSEGCFVLVIMAYFENGLLLWVYFECVDIFIFLEQVVGRIPLGGSHHQWMDTLSHHDGKLLFSCCLGKADRMTDVLVCHSLRELVLY